MLQQQLGIVRRVRKKFDAYSTVTDLACHAVDLDHDTAILCPRKAIEAHACRLSRIHSPKDPGGCEVGDHFQFSRGDDATHDATLVDEGPDIEGCHLTDLAGNGCANDMFLDILPQAGDGRGREFNLSIE